MPPEQWAICPHAFDPIITRELFDRAQIALANLTCRLSDEELLLRLRRVLSAHGKLTSDIIQRSQLCPGVHTYYKRFGGLLNAYTRLGYSTPELSAQATTRQRALLIRNDLVRSIQECFPGQIEEVRASKRFRALLKHRGTGLLISVVIARYRPTRRGQIRWLVEAPVRERSGITVIALLDENNASVTALRVFPQLDFKGLSMHVGEQSQWLQSGLQLEKISDLLRVIERG